MQAAYLVAGRFGTPGQEVEEPVHHVAVPPGDGAADAPEDDFVCDELINLVNVEAVVGSCPQATEATLQGVGQRLALIQVHRSGNRNGQGSHGDACAGHAFVNVDVVGQSV